MWCRSVLWQSYLSAVRKVSGSWVNSYSAHATLALSVETGVGVCCSLGLPSGFSLYALCSCVGVSLWMVTSKPLISPFCWGLTAKDINHWYIPGRCWESSAGVWCLSLSLVTSGAAPSTLSGCDHFPPLLGDWPVLLVQRKVNSFHAAI